MEEVLLEVTEPSVCVYDMVLVTPLACDDNMVKRVSQGLKQAMAMVGGVQGEETSAKEEL